MSRESTVDPAPPPSLTPLPGWRQRWGVIVSAVILLLVLLFALSGRSWPLMAGRLLLDLLYLIIWLAAAAGFGALVPLPACGGRGEKRADAGDSSTATGPSPQPSPRSTGERELRGVTRVALGLGMISLLQLFLGLAGQLHTAIAFGVIAIGIALLFIHCRRLRFHQVNEWLTAPATGEWLWLLAMPILAMAIVAAYVPPGILWGDEPHGYDVLEYHLQLPREWLELGRIAPLQHNVFSYFPLGVEMHYLLAMQLRGSPYSGMYLAQLMHVAFVVLTVVAISATARRLADPLSAKLAALAASAVPWLILLAPVAYNEGGLLLYGTLAIGWVLHSLSLREEGWGEGESGDSAIPLGPSL